MIIEELEAKFINLNPYVHQMFLQLNDMEAGKERDFVLETLTGEFDYLREKQEKLQKFSPIIRNTKVSLELLMF